MNSTWAMVTQIMSPQVCNWNGPQVRTSLSELMTTLFRAGLQLMMVSYIRNSASFRLNPGHVTSRPRSSTSTDMYILPYIAQLDANARNVPKNPTLTTIFGSCAMTKTASNGDFAVLEHGARLTSTLRSSEPGNRGMPPDLVMSIGLRSSARLSSLASRSTSLRSVSREGSGVPSKLTYSVFLTRCQTHTVRPKF